jgi:hypothetical protein
LSLCLLLGCSVLGQDSMVSLEVLSTYSTDIFDEGAAEIVDYDPASQRLFVVNGGSASIDILDISDPANPTLVTALGISEYGGGVNSVAIHDGLGAAAIQNADGSAPGLILFFDAASGEVLNTIEAGVLPDMVTFTPDGSKVLSANEGEPLSDYSVDPEGSVTVVDLSNGVENASATQITLEAYNDMAFDESIRVFGPGSTAAQDLEPEYIAVSPDSTTAYVGLQENNALLVIDLSDNSISSLFSLGFKDFSLEANAIDASNVDGAINITTWPVWGMYMPDSIAAYEVDGTVYVVSANEGDSRDYEAFSEEARVVDLTLDPDAFPNAAELQLEENLGRLLTTTTLGDTDGDGDHDVIYSFGARSFSIWNGDTGALVYDSGSDFERITAELIPDAFNSQGQNGSFDSRSDDKGPEPEAVTLAIIDGRTYAFIGLERVGGILVYDISDPANPVYQTYANNANYEGDAAAGTAGDVGPEGLHFIAAADSPNGENLLVVANEVSGSTTIYQVNIG